jgi:hypothetical protein
MILYAKSVFLAVNARLLYVGVYSRFLLLLTGQQGMGHFFKYWPLLPIG